MNSPFKSSNLTPQIADMDFIPQGDFNLGGTTPFLIKNNGEDVILEVQLYNSNKRIMTKFSSGWNVEVCTAVFGNISSDLQWGR